MGWRTRKGTFLVRQPVACTRENGQLVFCIPESHKIFILSLYLLHDEISRRRWASWTLHSPGASNLRQCSSLLFPRTGCTYGP